MGDKEKTGMARSKVKEHKWNAASSLSPILSTCRVMLHDGSTNNMFEKDTREEELMKLHKDKKRRREADIPILNVADIVWTQQS